jgi:sodium-dependent phosphate cotransporter
MGANIGTTVTNILVSLGHIGREKEFVRAFAASTVHDFFNMLAVLVLFPLQVWTNFLGRFASYLAGLFENAGGLKFANPLKAATGPVVKALVSGLGENPWLVLPVSLLLLFVALRLLVSLMKSLILGRVGSFFDQVIFKNAGRAMLFGLVLTVLVQSSSTTTSLIVPLAGVGLLTLTQVYPFTLGANVGTTITALLASLEGGTVSGVTVAFAHSLFNLSGIALIWPIPAIRRVPVQMATRLALATRKRRWVPFAFVGTAFFVVPILIILVLR